MMWNPYQGGNTIINPRRMRERVTVVGLCVCVCVCPVEISFYVRLHQPDIVPTVYKWQMLTF